MGIHIRMGDARMSKELGRVSGADDDKRSQVPLRHYLVHVNSLLQTLSWTLRPLDATGLQSKSKETMHSEMENIERSTGSHSKLPSLQARPVVFVASDSAKAVQVTKSKLAFKARECKRETAEEAQALRPADLGLSGLVQCGSLSALHRQESQLSRDPEGQVGWEGSQSLKC